METIGSLIDKICINELKIYHMTEQKDRTDVNREFKQDCEKRLSILVMQRDSLTDELQELMEDVLEGRKQMKPFRQMKMYNEKKFKD